ncbi:ImmA/IrrE family metallo-endopeptidase [Arthrobacter sp. AL08]|uniref:ImmA/IrrE family metallo-endopeptidase n=1 Tax=unclassified Arthrobacter TaxID=235627 RepID=UPI00249AA55A|nr:MULTISPECIES: ImmA/IrrE family metallo-endopeptidase [unclassified Arthrobacter]MDI3240235.1 ImmA/IrrE family metallo-endopeptidase [Arthrobacter sp. AL05]MDI3276245.1 ImmA/IrrE family metallo-endopeptidase [Arthrobacter sp. AL08]
MTTTQDFVPHWASPPGDTINDLIRSKDLFPDDIAGACGLDAAEFDLLIQGVLTINASLAEALSSSLGGSTSFWLRREERFREMQATLEADQWVQSLPLKSMKKLQWLDVPSGWRDRIDACFDYFGIDSLDSWKTTYSAQLAGVQFRTSASFASQIPAVSAWLRAGEILHETLKRGPFVPSAFWAALPAIRELTRVPDPENFLPRLQALTLDCGVSCVIVQTPEGCAASGASRILDDGSALIQLSGRYLVDDHFWFTFFHEAGHLLLHGDDLMHIDDDPGEFASNEAESQANTFSADTLWPLEDRPSSLAKPSKRTIVRMAAEAGTSPGIVVGQLQSSGVLDHAEGNYLKRRYVRHGSSLKLKRRTV